MTGFEHTPVMLGEVLESLDIKPNGIYVDGTLGGGGHALELCKRLGSGGRFLGIDQDEEAIEAAGLRLKPFGGKVTLVHGNFEQIKEVLARSGIGKADGILLDLGVSSHQLDLVERGFSYRFDSSPLDMRMDRRQGLTAKEMVNAYSEAELCRIFWDYGEERFARSIAKHIVRAREAKSIETGGELTEIIKAAIPTKFRTGGGIRSGHPAKRVYQALRIALNRELEVLEQSLDTMIDLLDRQGRISIISFHSLEDRIVKAAFKRNQDPCTCPSDFPVCICGKEPKGKIITKKPILPTIEEREENPRSKSAKLRVFERT